MTRKRLGLDLILIGCLLLASFLFVLPTLVQDDDAPAEEGVVILEYGEDVPAELNTSTILEWVQTAIMSFVLGIAIYYGFNSRGDAGVADAIEGFQTDRENVMVLERGYQNSPKPFQLAFDSATEFAWFFKNLTTLESPEKLALLLKDIAEPGPPAPETVSAEDLSEAAH